MKTPTAGSQLPLVMLQKLHEIRRKDRSVRLWTLLLRGAAILLGMMLLAMGADWLVVLYETHSRWSLTLATLGIGVVIFILSGLPLLRTKSLAVVARQLDLAHPVLEERFSTLAEVAQSKDAPELRGSESLTKKVAEQAVAMSGDKSADSVVNTSEFTRALKYCAIIAGLFILLFAFNFSQTMILFQRFWLPGRDISLTQLNAKAGDITIGKGESAKLEFIAEGKQTESANLFIRAANGRSEVISLRSSGTNQSQFAFTRASVVEPFEYRARAGDGQTAWHRVAVADRPKMARASLRVTPPAYSKLPIVEETALPRQIRALEGSELEASFQADQPLTSLELNLSDGKVLAIIESADGSHRFRTLLTNSFSFTPDFTNVHHLDNRPKTTCEIVVYKDEAPSIEVKSPGDEISARPDDKLKIDFEAKDDFGIAEARLVVTLKSDTNTTVVEIPIPLKGDEGKKFVRGQVELDLSRFDLKQDQELSYVVQVTDTKQNRAADVSKGTEEDAKQLAKQSPDTKPAEDQKSSAQQQQTASPNNAKSTAKNIQTTATEARTPSLRPDTQKHIAMNGKPSDPGTPAQGSQPPPNDMSKRVLDAGQCTSCKPMRVIVDEWGRSFEGQVREKLEIAVDPVLQQLEGLLGKAQDLADAMIATGKSPAGLSEKQTSSLEESRTQLRKADSVVTELKGKTHDTPYAFIGLQLHNIREAHVSPARLDLGKVSLESGNDTNDMANLELTSFEIKQAREKLAALTKSYASVKRDYKLADAMQRLTKMHQIFIEDTQAMLGSKKPVLNPQDRKVAEVSDEFAEKLRKLLEEKKRIMAELAKILADDPRMLRRFLAIEEMEAASLRDQMTLLAQRQQELAKEAGLWTNAGATNRNLFLRQVIVSQAADQSEVAELAAKMHENMVTWLPLDVSQDSELVSECRKLGADVARLAAEAAGKTLQETNAGGLASAHQSLEQLRSLDARLPLLEFSEWGVSQKLKLFAANRMNEVATLITRQSGWIKKIEALRSGDYAQVAEVDQHRLTLDTKTLSEKLEATASSVNALSKEIASKAKELNGTVGGRILPEQSDATDALSAGILPKAAIHQTAATTAFASAETQFDELLKLIIAKLDAAPPPTDAGRAETLEELMAMLQDEKKACEGLGIPCRPMNVNIAKDWLKSGTGSNSGAQGNKAQARAAQAQARQASERTDRAHQQVRKAAQTRAAELAENGNTNGPKPPANSWNTLVSQLGDELRQGRDNVPPEQYRQAIEQYFRTISDRQPAVATP